MRSVIAATAALLVLGFATPSKADGTVPLMTHIEPPEPLSYDESELGRATHDVRVTLTNPNPVAVPLSELAFRFRPKRDGVEYACKETVSTSDRWPSELRPGKTVSADRSITCETPLPGRYDVEVHARAARAGEDAKDQLLGSFPLQIDPGKAPPVALPWDERLYAAAETTKEIRPGEKSGRLFVAVINGSNDDITATPLRASLRVRQRGTKKEACPVHEVQIPFSETLEAGRRQLLDVPLQCKFPREGIYDVDVTIVRDRARVELGTFSVRAIVVPVMPVPRRPVNDRQR